MPKVPYWLGLVSALYAIFVWPFVMLYFVLVHNLPVDAMNGLLTYVGVVATGPIGGYIWYMRKKQEDEGL